MMILVRIFLRMLRITGNIIIYTSLLLFCFYMTLGAAGLVYRYKEFRVCVVLPNGLLLGRDALFNRKGVGGRFYPRLKLPNGDFLLDTAVHDLSFTQTTLRGQATPKQTPAGQNREGEKDGMPPYRFAYRADTGLVIETKNPELYRKVVSERGPAVYPPFPDHPPDCCTGLTGKSMFYHLVNRPRFRKEDCPLNIFQPPP